MTIEPEVPVEDSQDTSPTMIMALIAWIAMFLFVRRKLGLWAYSSQPNLLLPILGCAATFVFVGVFARPATRSGRVTLLLSMLPLVGLAITAAATACCPGGHPSLGGLTWVFTALISAPLLVMVLARLFKEARRGERRRFVVCDSLAVLFTYALATALIPSPI